MKEQRTVTLGKFVLRDRGALGEGLCLKFIKTPLSSLRASQFLYINRKGYCLLQPHAVSEPSAGVLDTVFISSGFEWGGEEWDV